MKTTMDRYWMRCNYNLS